MLALAMSDSKNPQSRALEALGRAATKAEKRLAFEAAVKAGAPIKGTADTLGVPESTARSWRSRMKRLDAAEVARNSALMSRGELAERFQRQLERAEDANDGELVIKCGTAYARLMGLEAPQRSEVMVRSVPASVVSWLHARIDTRQADDSDALLESATPTKQITSDC